jgi:hypothetical protein
MPRNNPEYWRENNSQSKCAEILNDIQWTVAKIIEVVVQGIYVVQLEDLVEEIGQIKQVHCNNVHQDGEKNLHISWSV